MSVYVTLVLSPKTNSKKNEELTVNDEEKWRDQEHNEVKAVLGIKYSGEDDSDEEGFTIDLSKMPKDISKRLLKIVFVSHY